MKTLIAVALLVASTAATAQAIGVLTSSRYLGGTSWACYYNMNGTTVSTISNGPCPQVLQR